MTAESMASAGGQKVGYGQIAHGVRRPTGIELAGTRSPKSGPALAAYVPVSLPCRRASGVCSAFSP
jgi:hypothetical protein